MVEWIFAKACAALHSHGNLSNVLPKICLRRLVVDDDDNVSWPHSRDFFTEGSTWIVQHFVSFCVAGIYCNCCCCYFLVLHCLANV